MYEDLNAKKHNCRFCRRSEKNIIVDSAEDL